MEKFNPRTEEFKAMRAAAAGDFETVRKLSRSKKGPGAVVPWVPASGQIGTTWVAVTGEALERKEREADERWHKRKEEKKTGGLPERKREKEHK